MNNDIENKINTCVNQAIQSLIEMSKLDVKVILDLDNWTVPKEVLQQHLLNPDEAKIEQELRFLGCDLIQAAGISLGLQQVAMSTAQMLFHRVYYTLHYSFDKEPFDLTAMAALFLAAKIEEQSKRCRYVIDSFNVEISKRLGSSKLKLTTQHYDILKSKLFATEQKILKNLGFCVRSSYPHKLISIFHQGLLNGLQVIPTDSQRIGYNKLLQLAWNYCNDSLRTDVFVRYRKEVVACACLDLASKDSNLPYPKSTDNRPWYGLFKITDEEIKEVCGLILGIYSRPIPDLSKYYKKTIFYNVYNTFR